MPEPSKSYPVFINDRTRIFWDDHAPETTMQFLDTIDEQALLAVSQTDFSKIKNQSERLAIRASYFHGLEQLFALICSTIQSTRYPAGWMLSYKNIDLREAITKIRTHTPIKVHLSPKDNGFEGIVSMIISNCISTNNEIDLKSTISSNSDLISALSFDLTNDNPISEYNSIKHGQRARESGFRIELTPGGSTSSNKPLSIESKNATKFFSADSISNLSGRPKLDFIIKYHTEPWNADATLHRIHFIAMWIRLIKNFLLAIHNPNTSYSISVPSEDLIKLCTNSECNISNLRYTLNYTLPKQNEFYAHETTPKSISWPNIAGHSASDSQISD